MVTKNNSAELTGADRLLEYLVYSTEYMSLDEILELFNISRRTAFNWLATINLQLKTQKLPPVTNIPRYGYKLSNIARQKLINQFHRPVKTAIDETSLNLGPLDRRTEIIWLLLKNQDNISINRLSTRFGCSRNTVIKDFKEISLAFPKLNIISTRQGRKIDSDERAVRLVIYELLQRHNTTLFNFIEKLGYNVTKYEQIIIDCQSKLHMNFSENAIHQLTFLLIFSDWRIHQGKVIQDESDYYWIMENTTNVISTSENIMEQLLGKNYSVGEVIFLSKVVLCSQATEMDCVTANLYDDLNDIAQEIIFRYEQLTGERVSYKLFTKVLSNHLYATFFRVKFEIPFSSSEIDEIKKRYPRLVKFTAIACDPLEQYLGKQLPSNEVALICLYFGSGNNNEYQDLQDSDKFKRASLAEVLVVCSSGIGTSVMLYNELSNSYPLIKFSMPLEIRELPQIFKLNYQAKLIISTAPLAAKDYPISVVNVKAILTEHDQNMIEAQFRDKLPHKTEHNTNVVNSLLAIINQYATIKDENGLRLNLDKFIFPDTKREPVHSDRPSLGSILPADHIKIVHNDGSLAWHDVLAIGCQLLEQDDIIETRYQSEILKLIDQYGPYMLIANDIFLAHAAPNQGSKKIGLSLILLDNPVKITAKNQSVYVTCVFVLSPGLKREHEKALTELIDIVRNTDNVKKLLHAKDAQTVRNIII